MVSRETDPRDRLFGTARPAAERYAEMLADAGVARGLIGPREVPRLWERHLLNCAVVADLLPRAGLVCDVGTGAGLPGLVLALRRPDLEFVLVDSVRRRTEFVAQVVSELRLENVTVRWSRAEQLVGAVRADAVTARALAPLAKLAQWCVPLTRPGGSVLALKGARAVAELAAAEESLRGLGVTRWSVDQVGGGVLADPTTVVRLRIPTRPTGIRSPRNRRAGQARQRGATT